MRTSRLALLAALSCAAAAVSCTGWLIDWEGTRCEPDGTCGGGLVCDPATLRCVATLPADADAGGSPDASQPDDAGLDAGTAEDAGSLDAGDAEDAGDDAGEQDAGPPGPPTRQCTVLDNGWCKAQLPALAGEVLPNLAAVSGYSESDIWIGGEAALLHWNGWEWEDRIDQLPEGATKVKALSGNADGIVMVTGGGGRLYWWSSDYSYWAAYTGAEVEIHGAYVGSNSWGGGQWRAAFVGEQERAYVCGDSCEEVVGPADIALRAVQYVLGEMWSVGDGGTILFGKDDESGNTPASLAVVSGPTGAALYAMRAFGDLLLIGGEGGLWECTIIRPQEGAPSLEQPCTSIAVTGGTVRGIWVSASGDAWAVASGGKVLNRSPQGVWSRIQLPSEANLTAVWGTETLLVVVGAGGTVYSKSL